MQTPRRLVRLRFLSVLLALAAAMFVGGAAAQDPPEPEAAEAPTASPEVTEEDLARLGTDSPRGAMYQFLVASRAGEYEMAAEHLNLIGAPAGIRALGGAKLARQLHEVLDRTVWIDWSDLSDQPAGETDDGLAAGRDRIGSIESRSGDVPILIERAGSREGRPVWKIAAPTVALIPELYDEFGSGAIAEILPPVLIDVRIFEAPLWQWLALVVVLFVALTVAVVITGAIGWILRRIATRPDVNWGARLVDLIIAPIRVLIAVGLLTPMVLAIGFPVPVQAWLTTLEKIATVIGVVWLAMRLVHWGAELIELWLSEAGHPSARAVVPLVRRGVKALLTGFAVLLVLQNFGVNVTGVLAGLGLGGLAFALAAQKTVENLFGGVTLIADRPVTVGDFCRFGDKVGTVEEIGLRSTRVRTLDRTVVTVPNGEFAGMQLENFARRDKFWFHPTIGVRYETTPDQMRFLLVELKRLLASHPKVDPDPARVRFEAFGAFSLDVKIFAYVKAVDYAEFLAITEDLNLRIMDIVAQAGTGFAFPSQTIYTGADEGLDEKLQRAAEKKVDDLRKEEALPLPSFRMEELAEMQGKLSYPPEGSVKA